MPVKIIHNTSDRPAVTAIHWLIVTSFPGSPSCIAIDKTGQESETETKLVESRYKSAVSWVSRAVASLVPRPSPSFCRLQYEKQLSSRSLRWLTLCNTHGAGEACERGYIGCSHCSRTLKVLYVRLYARILIQSHVTVPL